MIIIQRRMEIAQLAKLIATMMEIVERLNAMKAIAVGGRLGNALQKRNKH